jgi:MOSC domain-containing protein
MINLSELSIYPLKSCAQISLNRAKLSPFGLEFDRRWMLIDEQGIMLTQRKHARMCLIHSRLNNGQLTVNAPGMPALDIHSTNSIKKATVWEDTCNAYDCGDNASNWFSIFLNTPARLVYFPDDEQRQVDLEYAKPGDITAFSDGFPYLLISQASLNDLNSRLQIPVEMKRFRPNVVVTGNEAFAEDQWKRLRIGGIEFSLVKPCSRCAIPGINPTTAEKTAEPVKTLANYRLREKKILFGQNVIALGSGVLKVGMPVEILE